MVENDEDILTDDTEVLKQGILSSRSDTDNIDKQSDKRDRIDGIDDNKYDERQQIGERQPNEIYLEESETDEIYQIENATTFYRTDNQEIR